MTFNIRAVPIKVIEFPQQRGKMLVDGFVVAFHILPPPKKENPPQSCSTLGWVITEEITMY